MSILSTLKQCNKTKRAEHIGTMKKNVHEFGRSIEPNTHVGNSREIICREAMRAAYELKACFVTMRHRYNAYTLILMDIGLH